LAGAEVDRKRVSTFPGDDPYFRFMAAAFAKSLAPEFEKIVSSLVGSSRYQLVALIALARGCRNFNEICVEIGIPSGSKKVYFRQFRLFFSSLEKMGLLSIDDNGLEGRAKRYTLEFLDSSPLKPIFASMNVPKYEEKRKHVRYPRKQVSEISVVGET
jgi:hypothetical protein